MGSFINLSSGEGQTGRYDYIEVMIGYLKEILNYLIQVINSIKIPSFSKSA